MTSASGLSTAPESARFWPSGKEGSAERSSAATARQRDPAQPRRRSLGAAMAVARARGGGA
uniref:Uncharacterized protein n=1 Tax=Arundo donax TaxID=35708 RepID=A0A0A8Z899_ARUDO